MLTEKQAKDKWCLQTMINCGDGGENLQVCCASECMAWRWNIKVNKEEMSAGNCDEMVGYCGIAGKP